MNFIKDYYKKEAQMKKELGMLCREIRERHSLTREQVSDWTGISDKSIMNMETKSCVSYDLLLRLFYFYCLKGLVTMEDRARFEICF